MIPEKIKYAAIDALIDLEEYPEGRTSTIWAALNYLRGLDTEEDGMLVTSYEGFQIYDSGAGKLTAFDENGRMAIGHSLKEVCEIIKTMIEPPEGPDPCDMAREYDDAQYWAGQPTPYDP